MTTQTLPVAIYSNTFSKAGLLVKIKCWWRRSRWRIVYDPAAKYLPFYVQRRELGIWYYSDGFVTYQEAVVYLRSKLKPPLTTQKQITYFDDNGDALD